MAVEKNYIRFAGKNLSEFGVVLSSPEIHGAPSRDITAVNVPGKNGALTLDNGRFNNLTVQYHAGIKRPVNDNLENLRNFLLSKTGYQRLEDSYHKDQFRLGIYSGPFSPTVSVRNRIGGVDLSFNCKPQRFLKSGEREVEYTSNGVLCNKQLTVAKPLVRVYGTGTLTIGDETITINSSHGYTDIDCDIMDAFMGSTNCNGNITLSSGEFFRLEPGDNGINFSSGITKVIITPRWWIL